MPPTYSYALSNPITVGDANGLWPVFGEDFNFCFSNCLDRENARLINYSIPFIPLPKSCLPPFRTPNPLQPMTTPLSSLGNLLGGRANVLGSLLRDAGRLGSRVITPGLFTWSAGKTALCFNECLSEHSVADP